MKKIGLVAGVAVACVVIQGCKATTTRKGGNDVDKPAYVAPQPSTETYRPEPVNTVEETKPQATKKPAQVKVEPAEVPTQQVVAPPPAPATADTTVYVVKSGDTLSGICARYGLKQRNVLDANPGMTANKIFVGRRINLPGKVELKSDDAANAERKPVATKSAAPSRPAPKFGTYEGPTKEYVVVSGDSLGKIAYSNGITIRMLKKLNGLTKDTLRVGQKLKIPAEKQVAPAKTENKAAAKKTAAKKPDAKAKDADAKAKTDAPAPAAPESTEAAAPAGETAAPAAAETPADGVATPANNEAAAPAGDAAAAAAEPAQAMQEYVVKEGEDLVTIAIAFGLTPSVIADANDIKATDAIPAGTKLKIPVMK